MEKETLKKIFDFLEENDNKRKPLMWKLKNNIPITEKDDLIVKGSLDLSSSNITSLPKGLEVKGGLSLYESEIISLPEGLKVGRNLDLGFTKIISLPRGLKVEGFIDLNGTKLTEYTDDELRKMIKPGYIKGRIIKV